MCAKLRKVGTGRSAEPCWKDGILLFQGKLRTMQMIERDTACRLPKADFSKQTDNMPHVSGAELDSYAEAVAEAADPGCLSRFPDAVDLRKVFHALPGWHFRSGYLSSDATILGMTVFQEGTLLLADAEHGSRVAVPVKAHTILADKRIITPEREPTYRFTIGHEIGHALLHEPFFRKPENQKLYAEQSREYLTVLIDSRETMEKAKPRELRTQRDWVEWQANAFSSALLMPRTLVREAVRRTDRGGRDAEAGLLCIDARIEAVCLCFRVSPSAALYRLQHLRLIPRNIRWGAHGPVRI